MGCSDTNYVGCSFSLKQRKAIERKNGRVTAWNRPRNRGVKTVPTQNRGPFFFSLCILGFTFFVYSHQNLNQMQRDLTCVNLSTWKHDNHSKHKTKKLFLHI